MTKLFVSSFLSKKSISFGKVDDNSIMTWNATSLERYAEKDNPESPEEYSYLQSAMVRVKGRVP